jgi:hypothetical protein
MVICGSQIPIYFSQITELGAMIQLLFGSGIKMTNHQLAVILIHVKICKMQIIIIFISKAFA